MKFWFRLGQYLINYGSRALFGLRVEGKEKVPRKGGLVIAPNHLSYYDPPLVGSAVLNRQVYYLAKEELFSSSRFFSWLIGVFNAIPVKRDGFNRRALRHLLELIERGEAVCVFPEGTRSKTGNLLPPRRGFGYIVVRSGAPVVPTLVRGTNGRLKELFLRRSRLLVRFGDPISPERFRDFQEGSDVYLSVGQSVMEEIGHLNH